MIRLGVIGLSEGNGHPYSWSAICNGYDPETMRDCGFPSIPQYLAERRWPQDRLPGVSVTHVWAQDVERARHIAKAAHIDTVVSQPEQMIGAVDGLLLARDDAENHAKYAEPFLRAGIPVYLDKAPALSVDEFDRVLSMQLRPGLVFTGTALRFAKEFQLDDAARAEVGRIRHIFGVTPKSWDRYSIHIIEPAIAIAKAPGSVMKHRAWSSEDSRVLHVACAEGVQMHFAALGNVASPISLDVVGEKSARRLTFTDSFCCFRAALAEFVAGIGEGQSRTDLGEMRCIVELIEQGRP